MNIVIIVIGAIVIIALLMTSFHFFITKTFHTEIIINQTTETVWKYLVNSTTYNSWNTILIPLEGEIREGNTVQYEMTNEKGEKSKVNIKVKKVIKNKELNQVGGLPGILTFNHKYILEPTENGTKLVQHEIDRGIGLLFWNSNWIEPAYTKTSKNLKKVISEKEK